MGGVLGSQISGGMHALGFAMIDDKLIPMSVLELQLIPTDRVATSYNPLTTIGINLRAMSS